MDEVEIGKTLILLSTPFYKNIEFWLSSILGIAGVVFSVKAFLEAKKAKVAASEAGKTVKIQTITIELNEISQRLEKLDFNLDFAEARDLLNEVSRKLRRLIAPFQATGDLVEPCANLKVALNEAKYALDEVHPQEMGDIGLPPNTIYFATQGHFSNISGLVAEIMGLFEKRTIEVNE